MSEKMVKSFVSKQFGFKAVNVIPLECSKHEGQFDYLLFRVCGLEYRADLINGKWQLEICSSYQEYTFC